MALRYPHQRSHRIADRRRLKQAPQILQHGRISLYERSTATARAANLWLYWIERFGAPSGVDGNGPKRFSVQRKMAIVARLLRGEPLELVARETNVSIARLTEWRERALAGAATALKERERDDRDDEIARLKSKVGEITMDNEPEIVDKRNKEIKVVLADPKKKGAACRPGRDHSRGFTHRVQGPPHRGNRKVGQGRQIFRREARLTCGVPGEDLRPPFGGGVLSHTCASCATKPQLQKIVRCLAGFGLPQLGRKTTR